MDEYTPVSFPGINYFSLDYGFTLYNMLEIKADVKQTYSPV